MRGNYRKFTAWKCQWHAYLISSGLGRLWKQHPENAKNNELSKVSETHLLSALYSVMTLDTLELINSLKELKEKEDIHSDFIIDTIENLIAASDTLG